MEPTNQGEVTKLSQVIQIDEGKIQEHLGEVVRNTVEETLNAMLDAEADRLCRAERYERTEARRDTRAGSYRRHLQTKTGEVTLKVPKLRSLPFETAIIERYRRRESSVEEALVEMCRAAEGRPCGGEAQRDEAGGCSFVSVSGDRRDAVLLHLSPRALALSEDEQPSGTNSSRSTKTNESRWRILLMGIRP